MTSTQTKVPAVQVQRAAASRPSHVYCGPHMRPAAVQGAPAVACRVSGHTPDCVELPPETWPGASAGDDDWLHPRPTEAAAAKVATVQAANRSRRRTT